MSGMTGFGTTAPAEGCEAAMRYSGLRLFFEGLRGNRGWEQVWRKAEPKPAYEVIVVGGGGHGLATAY